MRKHYTYILWSLYFVTTVSLSSLSTAEAQAYEKMSLQGIQQLVHRSCQTLALWKLLCDHQFSLIISELPMVSFQHQ